MTKKIKTIAVGDSARLEGPCQIYGQQQDIALVLQADGATDYLVWHLPMVEAMDHDLFETVQEQVWKYVRDHEITSPKNIRAIVAGGVFQAASTETAGAIPKQYSGAKRSIETILRSLTVYDVRFECQNPEARGFYLEADLLKYNCRELTLDEDTGASYRPPKSGARR